MRRTEDTECASWTRGGWGGLSFRGKRFHILSAEPSKTILGRLRDAAALSCQSRSQRNRRADGHQHQDRRNSPDESLSETPLQIRRRAYSIRVAKWVGGFVIALFWANVVGGK